MRDRAPLSLHSLGRYIDVFRLVQRQIKQIDCQQIHAARPLFEGLVSYAISKRYGIPYICYVHGEDVSVARTSRQLKLVTNKVLGAASLIICNSEFSRQMLTEDWNIRSGAIETINPGVDTSFFEPQDRNETARAKLGWSDRRVVLTVGRLQRRKGQDNFIRSLVFTKRKIPNILYAVVGGGALKEELVALVQQNQLESNVVFHGEVSDETIRDCYQQCDLFCLPNRTDGADMEGFGMVSLEAQSCGKPAIVGNSGGTPETVSAGTTGVVIDCTDPQTISEQVVRLLNDRNLLHSMGRAARTRTVNNFDWRSITEKSSQIFEQL